eukprot:1908454-Amphidinium_carterae.1
MIAFLTFTPTTIIVISKDSGKGKFDETGKGKFEETGNGKFEDTGKRMEIQRYSSRPQYS